MSATRNHHPRGRLALVTLILGTLVTAALGTPVATASVETDQGVTGQGGGDTPVSLDPATGAVRIGPESAATGRGTTEGYRGTGRLGSSEGWRRGHGTTMADVVSPRSVIGTDGRVLVTNTTGYPWRTMVHITFQDAAANTYICTGTLYDADSVLTAGHCVNDGAGVWYTNWRVYPGKYGDLAPYGSCAATEVWSVTGWVTGADPKHDYGALNLDCTIGDTVGWIGLKKGDHTGEQARIAGYPGDKQPYYSLWKMSKPIVWTYQYRLGYRIDTAGGQSGSAVTVAGPYAVGIHAYGLDPATNTNSGTRMRKAVFDNLVSWAA